MFFSGFTFLRVKQSQQDFTYSYLDKQQIGKGVKFQIRPGNKGGGRAANLREKLENNRSEKLSKISL